MPVSFTDGGNDVERTAAVDRSDRHDGRLERRDLARDDALQRLDDPGRRDDRVGGLVGRGAVAARTLDLDRELVHGGHQRPAVEADLADRKLVPEVEAERGAVTPSRTPSADAGFGAAGAFLGRLEQEPQPRRLGRRREPRRERERDRRRARRDRRRASSRAAPRRTRRVSPRTAGARPCRPAAGSARTPRAAPGSAVDAGAPDARPRREAEPRGAARRRCRRCAAPRTRARDAGGDRGASRRASPTPRGETRPGASGRSLRRRSSWISAHEYMRFGRSRAGGTRMARMPETPHPAGPEDFLRFRQCRPEDLFEGALAVARLIDPRADVAGARARVAELASRVSARRAEGSGPLDALRESPLHRRTLLRRRRDLRRPREQLGRPGPRGAARHADHPRDRRPRGRPARRRAARRDRTARPLRRRRRRPPGRTVPRSVRRRATPATPPS